MKVLSIRVRETVTHTSQSSFRASKSCAMEMHPAGVLVTRTGEKRVLVPYSNIRDIELADEGG